MPCTRRVVLLSSQGAGTRHDFYHQPRAFEAAVQQSGLEWTVLRPGGFDSNAFQWIETVRSRRTIAAPFPDVGLPSIDPTDIAEVAAVLLRKDGHAGQVYELTGPSPISPRQQAQAIGDALGAPIRFVEQRRDEATAAERRVSPVVGQILGRPPRSFAEWAISTQRPPPVRKHRARASTDTFTRGPDRERQPTHQPGRRPARAG